MGPDCFIRRIALWEERLGRIGGKGEADDSNGAGPDNQALGPETDEADERSEGVEDVGVVASGLLDHAAKLGITVSANHGEKAAH